MNCKVIKKSGNPPFLHQPPLYSFVPLSSKKFRTPPPPQVTPLIRGGGGSNNGSAIAMTVNITFYDILKSFIKVQLLQKISKHHFLFIVPSFSGCQWKYLWHFVLLKEVIHVEMSPPPPQEKQIKASLLKACGFSVVMFGNTLIANQCFVECIIFYLPIMTSQ